MNFSNEWRSTLSKTDVMTLDHRLSAVTRRDVHAGTGFYVVHCLYFQEIEDIPVGQSETAGRQSEHFRIRYYDDNIDYIKLEKKYESNGVSVVEACQISREFVTMILNRDFSKIVRDPMGRTGDELEPLIQEFYWNVVGKGMLPKLSVEYRRRPYIYPYGDVRLTIDFNFKSSSDVSGFLNPDRMKSIPGDGKYFIKVKWNNYVPEIIKSAVSLINRKNTSYYLYEPMRVFM